MGCHVAPTGLFQWCLLVPKVLFWASLRWVVLLPRAIVFPFFARGKSSHFWLGGWLDLSWCILPIANPAPHGQARPCFSLLVCAWWVLTLCG